ncbi:carboxylesterase 5A-like [Tubulanus polymorphus]|uniref:carboxylesterase 5A-like n=1 Tax=Tubulanus polymorphus TaxID=672921 RepID=UPI003DA403E6
MEVIKVLYAVSITVIIVLPPAAASNPKRNLSIGIVEGADDNTTEIDLEVYLGIPYAEPPIRFARPEPIKALPQQPFNADKHGAPCPAPPFTPGMKEDCLTLDIYLPKTNDTKAVMFIVPISDGVTAWSSSDLDPRLLAAHGDVIVVIINYRSGILGFLSTHDSDGNYGIYDQELALLWVAEHIDKFGGDNKLITVSAQGEGGARSAVLLAMSPATTTYVKRVISESTSILAPCLSHPQGQNNGTNIAQYLGCTWNTSGEMLACLKSKGVEELINATQARVTGWSPVPDDYFFISNITQALSGENCNPYQVLFAEKDLLTGVNGNEAAKAIELPHLVDIASRYGFSYEDGPSHFVFEQVLVPFAISIHACSYRAQTPELTKEILTRYTADTDTERRDELVEMLSDSAVGSSVVAAAVLHARSNKANTYMYVFEYESLPPDPIKQGWVNGPEMVGQSIYLDTQVTTHTFEEDEAVAMKMVRYWSNFVKSGDPNFPISADIDWPKFTLSKQEYLQISGRSSSSYNFTVEERYRYKYMQPWINDMGLDADELQIQPPKPNEKPKKLPPNSGCKPDRITLKGQLGLSLVARDSSTIIMGLIIAVGVVCVMNAVAIVYVRSLKLEKTNLIEEDKLDLIDRIVTDPGAGPSDTGNNEEAEMIQLN